MSAVVESESKAKELNDGLRNVLANMKEAEVKFAAADKSGIKSDEVYALVTTTVKKEQVRPLSLLSLPLPRWWWRWIF